MVAGDSCTYTVKATCGAPGFYVVSTSTAIDASFAISFIEY